jgi:hypothetical protein
MKVVFTYDKRTYKPDWFIYLDQGPLPPIVNPAQPDIPQDTGPPTKSPSREIGKGPEPRPS